MLASFASGSALAGLIGPEMNVASREMKVVRTINDFFMESILGRVHGLTKTYAKQTTLFAIATIIPGIRPRQETLYSLTFHCLPWMDANTQPSEPYCLKSGPK